MNAIFKLAIFAAILGLAGCAAGMTGAILADLPHDYGGLPPGTPPRPGTLEYDEWQRQRAIDAATPKFERRVR